MTCTQSKGKDEWLEQFGSQQLERSTCLDRWDCPRGGVSKGITGRIAHHLVSSPKGIECLSDACGSQKRVLDSLELELEMVVSHSVGAETQIEVV